MLLSLSFPKSVILVVLSKKMSFSIDKKQIASVYVVGKGLQIRMLGSVSAFSRF